MKGKEPVVSGLPEAESRDQSWMNPPSNRAALPKAEYNEFNPPPDSPKPKPTPEEQTLAYVRAIHGFLLWASMGGIAILVIYLLSLIF